MNILSEEEGKKWLQNCNLPTKGRELRIYFKNSMVYQYAQTSGKIIVLAESIKEIVGEIEKEGAFWITDWDISYENMNLFDVFRKGLHENRTIQQASFHVFNKGELAELESLMDMAMFFTWDSYLILPNRGLVFSPNDEFLHVSCKEEADFKRIKELFEWMEFKDVTKWWNNRMAKLKDK